MKQIFCIFIIVLFTLLTTTVLKGQILYNNVGHIPQSCQVDWTNAGLLPGTSFDAVDVYVVTNYGAVPNDGQDDHSAIMAAISAAQATAGLAVVYFPTGTYNVNNTISLSRTGSDAEYSDIVLQGAGSDLTVLQFTVGSTNHCINIYGVTSGGEYGLSNIVTKGSTQLERSDLSMFNVNDWILLCEENFPYGGSESRFVGQITQLIAINYGAGQATMKDEASKEYRPEYNLWIQKLYPIMNVGIEDLKIQRLDPNPVTGGGANINFNYAVNCWVKGVESDNTTYNHLAINRCSHMEISGNYIHHARSYGEWDPSFPDDLDKVRGTGYGMTISYSSTNCLIVNNIWHHLRHAMTVGIGVNCNVFAYNYSSEQTSLEPQMLGDICLHGRYPYANLFEQNVVCQISADDTHQKNGPYNAFLRNWVVVPPFDRVKLHGPIWLHDAPNTGVLGCETWQGPGENPISSTGSTTSLSADIYGYFNGAFRTHADMTAYPSNTRLNYSFLYDVSYYYSSRPDYLDMSYTWPSLGPVYAISCCQSIPALDRYSSETKTYLNDPTSKPLITSGTLYYDQTWSGIHTLTGDVTINSNITLTILPGTTVKIPSGKKITVQGTLIAEGTANERIYFDKSGSSKWYGIKFEDSSDDNECILKYCTIQNASYGAYCYKSSPFIYNCYFNNNTIGIYASYGTTHQQIYDNDVAYNWTGASLTNNSDVSFYDNEVRNNSYVNLNCYNVTIGPQINDNLIHHCTSGNGVNLNYSNPYFLRNSIYDNDDYGVYCNGSSPEFDGDQNGPGNNVVAYNGSYGIYINSSSQPVLGGTTLETSQNSYYSNNTYEIYSLFDSWIGANYCYWGGGTPQVYGNIWTLNQLSNDPNQDPHGVMKTIATSSGDSYQENSSESKVNEDARKYYDLA